MKAAWLCLAVLGCGARTPLDYAEHSEGDAGPSDAGHDARPDSGCEDICGCPVEVPEGAFTMGDFRSAPATCAKYDPCVRESSCDHQPPHEVHESAFLVSRYEATAGCYAECMAAGSCDEVPQWNDLYPPSSYWSDPGHAWRPAYGLTRDQARSYCAWLDGRLPTEAEWEKAARGTDGRAFPWGDEPPDCEQADLSRGIRGECLAADAERLPLPVTSRPLDRSPWGAQGMAGGVREWVSDEYDPAYYERDEEWRDPEAAGTCACDFCPVGVRRGGSFVTPTGDPALDFASTFVRAPDPGDGGIHTGVRCVWDP